VSMSVALIADRVVHVLPALVALLYAWVRWLGIAYGVRWVRHTEVYGRVAPAAYFFLVVYLMPLAVPLSYAMLFDMREVYGLDSWSLAVAPAIAIVVLTLFSGVLFVVASRHEYHLYDRALHGAEMRASATQSALDVLARYNYPASADDVVGHSHYRPLTSIDDVF